MSQKTRKGAKPTTSPVTLPRGLQRLLPPEVFSFSHGQGYEALLYCGNVMLRVDIQQGQHEHLRHAAVSAFSRHSLQWSLLASVHRSRMKTREYRLGALFTPEDFAQDEAALLTKAHLLLTGMPPAGEAG